MLAEDTEPRGVRVMPATRSRYCLKVSRVFGGMRYECANCCTFGEVAVEGEEVGNWEAGPAVVLVVVVAVVAGD